MVSEYFSFTDLEPAPKIQILPRVTIAIFDLYKCSINNDRIFTMKITCRPKANPLVLTNGVFRSVGVRIEARIVALIGLVAYIRQLVLDGTCSASESRCQGEL